jgi:hypothetical protein
MNRIIGLIQRVVLVIIVYPLSVLIVPIFRIPLGKEIELELKLMPKVIPLADFIRPWGESVLGNVAVFFSCVDKEKPDYLYMSKKDISQLPEDTIHIKFDGSSPKRTAILTIRTRKSVFGSFLPASLLSFSVTDETPDWTK